jgi:hypothetical protein
MTITTMLEEMLEFALTNKIERPAWSTSRSSLLRGLGRHGHRTLATTHAGRGAPAVQRHSRRNATRSLQLQQLRLPKCP